MTRRGWPIGFVALILVLGCETTRSIQENSPAAATPKLTKLRWIPGRPCNWTDAMPNGAGEYELLPGGDARGDIQLTLQAPWPSKLEVLVGQNTVLRELDGTQSEGEGSFKIDSVDLATTQDTFDWKVTITPPTSDRMDRTFVLNIFNRSVNPNHSGADARSAPLALTLAHPPVPDLEAWLVANPYVTQTIEWKRRGGGVSGYTSWSSDEKRMLRERFASAWTTDFLLLEDPPRNLVTLRDDEDVVQVLSESDAWQLYLTYVAYSLAVEIGGRTSWSLNEYSVLQLRSLLSSWLMFTWNPDHNGYELRYFNTAGVVPASPWTTLTHLYSKGIYSCLSRPIAIARALDWSRSNLIHFSGGFDAQNMEAQWQYRGSAPVVRTLAGTPFPGQTLPSISGIRHRTAGCWGTTGFLRAILRVQNIPVDLIMSAGHALPYFPADGLYLSHGDDPYSRLSKSTPPFPARELLIDEATFDAWFGPAVSATTRANNIGRQTKELALIYLPDELLRHRCKDLRDNKSNADGDVFATFDPIYSLQDLEDRALWTSIDAKIAERGGCQRI